MQKFKKAIKAWEYRGILKEALKKESVTAVMRKEKLLDMSLYLSLC
jgi:hypothetical protein